MPKSASLQWPSWSNSTLSSLRSLKERASSICRTARPHTPMGWLVGWVIRPHQASFRHPPQRKQTSLGYLGKSFGSTLKICLMVPRQWSYVNRSPRLTTERQWFPLMVGGGSSWSLQNPPSGASPLLPLLPLGCGGAPMALCSYPCSGNQVLLACLAWGKDWCLSSPGSHFSSEKGGDDQAGGTSFQAVPWELTSWYSLTTQVLQRAVTGDTQEWKQSPVF